ncbi:MAG: hypothetical protein ACHRHE_13545 [Tepidisphaerales bacterium]
MGLGRFLLLGDLGLPMDSMDHEQRIAELRRRTMGSSIAMLDQSRQIEALYDENADLKMCVAALISLLVEKGMLSREEVSQLQESLQRPAQPTDADAMGIDDDAAREADSSMELADLAKAARETGK